MAPAMLWETRESPHDRMLNMPKSAYLPIPLLRKASVSIGVHAVVEQDRSFGPTSFLLRRLREVLSRNVREAYTRD